MTSSAPPLILDSLRRRMRAMHSLYEDAVASMELHHVNHFEREGVLPIAFSLFHYINMQDVTSGLLMGEAPVWATGGWQARVQMAINDHGKERPVSDMIHQRVGDYEAFVEYQRPSSPAPRRGWPPSSSPTSRSSWSRARYPPGVANTYSARVAGEEGITVLDAIECWIYQHGLRHMGEIELARGLVGLGGMTS